MTQKIGMHVRMNQLVQDGHLLRPRRPLQTLRAQEEGLLLGHITHHEPLRSVRARHSSVVLLWCLWWSLY